jgi:NAD(P)-dependent dehydrogenase (short-subunit alcohol dehydrogenase family)
VGRHGGGQPERGVRDEPRGGQAHDPAGFGQDHQHLLDVQLPRGRWSPAYAATKHGIAGLTKAYCDELAQFGIQVNGIAPGYYATAITAVTRSDPASNQRVLDHIPAGRWGEPVDLMGALVFLASRASDYVNGHVLAVDGGYLVR